jgi:predicted SnoaL-like aldol condensation-catalyzing enzyme
MLAYANAALAIDCKTIVPSRATDPKAKLAESNKQVVLDFFKVVFDQKNAQAATDYLAEDYVQHNPNVPTGRDGFLQYFTQKWKDAKPAKEKTNPDVVMTQDDLVMLMQKYKKKDPKDDSKTYDAFWFDLFRVKDGKLVEHWDNALKQE